MKRALDIIPECYVDTNLVGFLLGEDVNHQYGCNQVANTMLKEKNSDRFFLGIVDDDKTKHSYLKDFCPVAKSDHLELMKHPERPHYFMLIKKAAEDLIDSAARELQFDFSSIGLKNGVEGLKKTTKDCHADVNPELRKAFAALLQAREIKIFRNVLKYLNEKKYGADMDVIVRAFQGEEMEIRNA